MRGSKRQTALSDVSSCVIIKINPLKLRLVFFPPLNAILIMCVQKLHTMHDKIVRLKCWALRILEPTQDHQRSTIPVVMKNMAEHCTGYICSCFVVCFVFFLSFRLSCGVLYSSADHTVLLENDTISNVIHNSPTAWVVEFYSSFCGHCHAFAPTWKKLAKMGKGEFTTIDVYLQIQV